MKASMRDPLGGYPEMMSTEDLAEFLGVVYSTAWEWMNKLETVNVGLGRKNKARRVLKQVVRKQFNVPEPRGAGEILEARNGQDRSLRGWRVI